MNALITVILVLLFFCNEGKSVSYPSVIVLGAGPSGIAAASKLLENNFTEVVVLEAENRIGGRIRSVNFGGGVVELGAEFCHGEENNTVYALVKDLDLLENSDLHFKIHYSTREEIDDEFNNDIRNLFLSIYYSDGRKGQAEEISIGDYFLKEYNNRIEQYKNNNEYYKILKNAEGLMHHLVDAAEGCFSWFAPAADSDYLACAGDHNLNWGGRGYKTILDVLMKKIPDINQQLPFHKKIILNKEVKSIIWENNTLNPNGVTIQCADGSIYNAEHVIVTTSLGVLKANYKDFFRPELPTQKQNAIEELGIGAVMKIVLHFPERWWPFDNFSGFDFIWSAEDAEILSKEFTEGPVVNGKSWLLDLYGFITVVKNPNVLMGWITGSFVPKIELLSDEILINGSVFVMKKFLGHKFNVSRPDAIIRSNWYTNPHFRGTYSYQTTASRKRNVSGEIALSEPLTTSNGKQTVLFAGEATHPYHYSTVHGAIESGFREAQRIIDTYN